MSLIAVVMMCGEYEKQNAAVATPQALRASATALDNKKMINVTCVAAT